MESKEKFIKLSHDYGVPKDQLENFLRFQYIPLPWQLKFHGVSRKADKENGPVDIGIGGARGPGKSHGIFAQLTLDDCQRIPKLKGLFLRQTGKAAEESFQDLIESVLSGKIAYRFVGHKGLLIFPNSSRVLLGGFETEKDIDKYVGIQYDVIAIEERNQLTGEKVMKLKGSLRTIKKGWRARMYSSFNPGNIGHDDIKKTFITPFQMNQEKETRFIGATYRDNPYLKSEYIAYLESLQGTLGKAWREGNFETFEGQYFIEWNISKHTVAPFKIPETWKKFRSYDHGRDAPACCKWYALDYDGRVWVYREFYERGLNIDQIAQKINEMSIGEQYDYSIADSAIFAKTGFVDRFGGQTIAETFARYGIMFIPSSKRRVDGWNLMHQYLYWDSIKQPKLIHFSTCVNSIRTLPSLIHDTLHPEDLDTRGEDHAADCDRYFLMSLHERKTMVPKTDVEKKLDELKRQEFFNPTNLNEFYGGEL